MALADRLKTKLDNVLTRFNVTDRVVAKRIKSSTGGDPLTGRGATTTATDTVFSPQPAVEIASKEYPLVVSGQVMAQDADYLMTVSSNMMTRSDVTNPNLSIIFTDSSGAVEELFIVGFSPVMLNGVDVSFSLILASKKR